MIYYINISEIPGELSGVNMVSSHFQIICGHMLSSHVNSDRVAYVAGGISRASAFVLVEKP